MARKIYNGLDLQDQRIIRVGSPAAPTDAVNRSYVDNRVKGQVWKDAVRAASTASVTVASPGSTIDGVTLQAGDRVLLKNQADASQNGIYQFNGASSAMTRTEDANDADTLLPNSVVYASEGDVHADTQWTLSTDAPIVVGTTDLQFVASGGTVPHTAGDGLDLVGLEFSVKPGNGISVSSTGVAVDTSVVARKHSGSIGDGTTTSIPFAHNLGTRNVAISVHDATTFEEVYPDVIKTDPNTVTLVFAVAPATGEFVVTVIG